MQQNYQSGDACCFTASVRVGFLGGSAGLGADGADGRLYEPVTPGYEPVIFLFLFLLLSAIKNLIHYNDVLLIILYTTAV